MPVAEAGIKRKGLKEWMLDKRLAILYKEKIQPHDLQVVGFFWYWETEYPY